VSKLTRNRAQCPNCLDIIESKHRHDFVVCSCWGDDAKDTGIFVDGGLEDTRRGWHACLPIELSTYEEDLTTNGKLG
jgi:hypothetical protein